ncbi:VaFE repeat-containing surface-anchored protein [Candidatus Saccharibacteria bacterium]|nr:VaFE repeat-containing surface-anchored protein [Candidatus Saccharibacteria bacterium]
MLVLYEKKIIFRKLFFSFLFILILSISVFGVVKTIQKYANAAEVYVTGDGNYASYGVYGNGSSTAQTDQYKVRGSINAYCANPSKLGLNTGYYTIGSAPSGYYDSMRLLIYLSTVGYSAHSSDSIMTTLFGSDKGNSTMRYVLTHIAIGAMYANDRSYLSSQGSSQATAIINGLSNYINSNGSAYIESKNYSLYRIADTSERQALIWIEQNATPTPTPTPGKVRAIKESSSSTDEPSFAGIEFSLYTRSSCTGTAIDTKTISGSSDRVVFDEDIEAGETYYIKETATNSNYYLTDTSCKSVTATTTGTGSSATATFTNEPIPQSNPGKVRAIKQSSSSTHTPSFSGIKFSLYTRSSCTGTAIDTKTISGSSDRVVFDEDIEVGDTYYIKETATNSNYYLTDTSCKSVTATASGTTSSATATFTNDPIIPGKVTAVKKSSSNTYTPSFAGIQFSIYSSSSCSGTPIDTKTLSGSNSSVIFNTNLTEGTTYYIKESIGTNTNYYETDTSCKSVTATENGTESSATVTFTNNPIIPGKVKAIKQSSSSTYTPSFAGIQFSVYSSSNCSGTPISTKTLSDNDTSVIFDTNLEADETYYIKESIGTNTNYYETDTGCKSVAATVNGTETFATATFVNEPIGKIKVNKCDAELSRDCTNAPSDTQGNGTFDGITFSLYSGSCEGTLIATHTLSNGDSSVTFSDLVAGQTYYVKEAVANNAFYNLSSETCKSEVADPDPHRFFLAPGGIENYGIIYFNNTIKKTSIRVNKRDAETNSCTTVGNNSFNGTTFQLINKSTNSIYYNNTVFAPNSVVDTKTLSSGSCEVTFENLPYGTYQISETPSNGYNGGAAQTVTLSSPEAAEITFTNTAKKGQIIVNKIDADTNSCTPYNGNFPLDGTSFTLTNKTGGLVYHAGQAIQNNDVIMTQTLSDGICQITFENLPYGDYEITEQPSFGYIPITPTTQLATISEAAETITKTFENRFVAQSLGTVAVDSKDDDKFVEAENIAKIVDTVSYCVVPGVDFVLEGTLMDKNTGEELLIDGNPVKSSIPLNATTECGEIEMEFEFDSSSLGGQDIVVFEKLFYQDTLVLEHSDLNDTDQTLTVLFLRTFATNRSTKKKILPLNQEVEIVDEVEYCLKTDLEYTLEGTIMDKSTGDKLLVDDAPVEDELTFTPAECCGQVEMSFTLNTKDLAGAELVIFENLYQDEQLVLEHNNLYNVDQTVHVETPLPTPEPVPDLIPVPNTGKINENNNHISESFNIVLVACSAFAVGIIGYIIYRKISKVSFSRK